jgi:hypothetical protein
MTAATPQSSRGRPGSSRVPQSSSASALCSRAFLLVLRGKPLPPISPRSIYPQGVFSRCPPVFQSCFSRCRCASVAHPGTDAASVISTFTGFPFPFPRFVSHSLIACASRAGSTLSPASSRPSPVGSVSSNSAEPVKFRMQKLSSHSSGAALRSPSIATSTSNFFAYTREPFRTSDSASPLPPPHGCQRSFRTAAGTMRNLGAGTADISSPNFKFRPQCSGCTSIFLKNTVSLSEWFCSPI